MGNLILLAHPTKGSFCHQISEICLNMANDNDSGTVFRDLYEINFNPVLTNTEIDNISNNHIESDIRIEQDILVKSKKIIIIYPIWWGGMPAILKGYFDRVFTYGFAFKSGSIMPEGLFYDKEVLIFSTHGAPVNVYENQGMYAAFEKTVEDSIFKFVNARVYQHKFFSVNKNTSNSHDLDEVRKTIKGFLYK